MHSQTQEACPARRADREEIEIDASNLPEYTPTWRDTR